MRKFRTFAAVTAAVCACVVGVASAGASAPLSITAIPALSPAFDPEVSDYVSRCTAATPVQVSVGAPAGTLVAVDGQVPQTGSFTAAVSRAVGQRFSFSVLTGGAASTYNVRCLPSSFPLGTADRTGPTQFEYLMVAPFRSAAAGAALPAGLTAGYVAIYDNNGVPIWWYDTHQAEIDAKLLPSGNLAWGHFTTPGIEIRRLDGSLVQMLNTADIAPGDPSVAHAVNDDPHEVLLLPNGHYILMSYAPLSNYDLSPIGGASSVNVLDSVIQEIDPTKSGAASVVWQWSASQHVAIDEASAGFRASILGGSHDLFHMNAIDAVGDGTYITSLSFMGAVYKISPSDPAGRVIWKLAGSTRPDGASLQVSGDHYAGNSFGLEHDSRILPDGSITVHDNGNTKGRLPRALRYQVDTSAPPAGFAGTATLLETVTDPVLTTANSGCCGSARKLPGGNWVIGWGRYNVVTECTAPFSADFTSACNRVFRMSFASDIFSYRTHPILPGVLSRAQLVAGMDAMFPVSDTAPPAVAVDPTGSSCSDPGTNGWCKGTQAARFTAADDSSGVAASVCPPGGALGCSFKRNAGGDGSAVLVSSGPVCDVAGNCTGAAAQPLAGPFMVDATPPTIVASGTTADGYAYVPGFASSRPVTVHFTCTDATSGVAGFCPPDVIVSGNTGLAGQTVAGSISDNAGNDSAVALNVRIDTAAPRITLTALPGSFTFTSTLASPLFRCSIDGVAAVSCSSPRTYNGLGYGQHTLAVSATGGGVTSQTAALRWTIAAPGAPDTFIDSVTQTGSDVTLVFHANQSPVRFQCKLDSLALRSCVSPYAYHGLGGSAAHPGSHTILVVAVNLAAQSDPSPASASVTTPLDSAAPTVSLNPAGDSCSNPGTGGWCRGTQTVGFKAADQQSGLPAALCGGASGVLSCAFTRSTSVEGAALLVGSGPVCDVAGNCVAPGRQPNAGPYRIDHTPPTIAAGATTADGNPYVPGTRATQAVTVHFTCADALSGVPASGPGRCPADVVVSGATDPSGQDVTGAVADVAGNGASVAVNVKIDPAAPGIELTAMPATFKLTTTTSLLLLPVLHCSLDGAPFATCSTPITFHGVGFGPHTLSVYLTATGGLTSPPATFSWIVPTPAPPDTIIDSTTVSGSNVTVAFHSTQAGSSAQCSIDGSAWKGCSGPMAYHGLTGTVAVPQAHTFQVRAVNAAGLIDPTPASVTFTTPG